MKQGINRFGLLMIFWSVMHFSVTAQEVKYRADYHLKGPVKNCTVLTSYGKEIYRFTKDGKLKELTSFFDDENYQKITYSYKDSVLIERRIEVYEMGRLDQASSLINIYQNDSLFRLQRELIADYKGKTLEEKNYIYDSLSRLKSLKRLTNRGLITSKFNRAIDSLGVYKRSVLVDSVLNVTVDSIPKATVHKDSLTEVRTVYYLDGFEDRAELKKYNNKNELVFFKKDLYLMYSEHWYTESEEAYDYDQNGQLIQKITKEGNTSFKQNYIYQIDGSSYQNWVKQIVKPNMTYTTRIIEYYEDN